MLVYGDRSARVATRERIAEILESWRAAGACGGIERHSRLVGAFISLGQITQGVADHAFHSSGRDERDTATDALMAMLAEMATVVAASWDRGFAVAPAAELSSARLLRCAGIPDEIFCRRPEGYAYYAVYPEAYAEAANFLGRSLTHVIGLRSIGTSLAAMVAARLRAPAPATLRPHGDPFQRRVTPGPALEAEWLSDPVARFAVVDEGPGLSGSSFGSVCDWLEDRGVDSDRIVLFPSHGNPPGGMAAEPYRRRWAKLERHFVDSDKLLLDRSSSRGSLQHWASDALSEPLALARDISGGAWRAELRLPEEFWPGVDTFQERRKFLLAGRNRTVLARFAGLGEAGRNALARARRLNRERLVPEPLGLLHGFLLEAWHSEARPLADASRHPTGTLAAVAHYLGYRARLLPAPPDAGAALSELAAMAVHNAREALGDEVARSLETLSRAATRLQRAVRRTETDNRMDPHEWIALPDGRILKTDAVDHCAGHDLVGCQDPAWDLAAAALEFDLGASPCERLRLASSEAAGRAIEPELVAFYMPCYAAFRLGLFTVAANAHGGNPPEQARLQRRARHYAGRLLDLVRNY